MSRTNDGYKPAPIPNVGTKGYQPLCVPKTLNPTVMVMKSAQDGT
jgi:hypothetical protein